MVNEISVFVVCILRLGKQSLQYSIVWILLSLVIPGFSYRPPTLADVYCGNLLANINVETSGVWSSEFFIAALPVFSTKLILVDRSV